MTEETPAPKNIRRNPNPVVAGILGWLVPGLGHIYAGDTRRGLLFLVVLVGMLLLGQVVSGGEAVDIVLHNISFYGELGAGLPTAAIESVNYFRDRKDAEKRYGAPVSFAEIKRTRYDRFKEEYTARKHVNSYAELGLLLATIAGLFNILVLLDAAETAMQRPPEPQLQPQADMVEEEETEEKE